jgi:gliding motility-associated-like protein
MKKLRLLIALLFLVTAITLAAQANQANNWHFGDSLSVSFVGGVPVLNSPSAMEAFEGIASMSDSNGQLLFYTNGGGRPFDPTAPSPLLQNPGTIWNRNHEVMYDMRGEEGGGFSARQSSIAMPDPSGEPGVYYLFTMDEIEFDEGGNVIGQPQGRGLSYFIIDMNLNGGLGGVRLADQRVYVPSYEALDATPMADGSGYWIICQDNLGGDAKFIVTPLTAAGVGTPVSQPVGRVSGKIEFSPSGLLILNDQKLYAFDNATGTVADDPIEVPDVSFQEACFTPDSRYIYAIQSLPVLGKVIVRLDLQDMSEPPLVLERLQSLPDQQVLLTASLQIGPNGNIYFLEQTLTPGGSPRYGLSEIVCVSGNNPSVNRYLIDLPYDTPDFLAQSLPQFVDAIFAVEPSPDTTRLEAATVIACNDDSATLTARDSGTNYLWSTGAITNTIAVSEAGVYCVTITGDCFPVVDCQTVVYEQTGITPLIIGREDLGCEGLQCIVDLDISAAYGGVRISLFETNPFGSPILISEFLSVTDTVNLDKPEGGQQYSIEVTYENCGQITYPLMIDFPEDDRFRPVLGVTADGEVCEGKDITLEVSTPAPGSLEIASVRYDDGNTDNPRTLEAMFQTDIFVTVFSECGDSTELAYTGPVAEFCNCRGEIPELISPNGDNVNDEFRLYTNCPAEDYTLMIFNRWGQPVFESTNADQAWDGSKDGTPQNSDIYLYRMVFRFPNMEEVEVREGKFSLVR